MADVPTQDAADDELASPTPRWVKVFIAIGVVVALVVLVVLVVGGGGHGPGRH